MAPIKSTWTDPASVSAPPSTPPPPCPNGHGRMRRSLIMSTGTFPGWWSYCTERTCRQSDYHPVR